MGSQLQYIAMIKFHTLPGFSCQEVDGQSCYPPTEPIAEFCRYACFVKYERHSFWHNDLILWRQRSGPRLNIKTVFPRYGDSNVKDKTAARPSSIWNNLSMPGLKLTHVGKRGPWEPSIYFSVRHKLNSFLPVISDSVFSARRVRASVSFRRAVNDRGNFIWNTTRPSVHFKQTADRVRFPW